MLEKLRKPGGWWRLWIVISAVWTAIVITSETANFDFSRDVSGTIAGRQPITVENVPYYLTRTKIKQRTEQGIHRENEYARLVMDKENGRINANQFDRKAASIGFHPPIGWKPSDASPLGPVIIGPTPLDRALELALRAFTFSLSLPILLLAVGLATRWVIDGFRRRGQE